MSINQFSNPKIVDKKAKQYLGKNVKIKISDKPIKKYMVLNPNTKNWIHFGQMGYQDFTSLKNKDPNAETRRKNYLARTANIKGNWKDNKYSKNNIARHILW